MKALPIAAALAALVSLPGDLVAQETEPVATLSTDSVSMAEIFELQVEVPVPPSSVVYFPDTLASTSDIESFGSVEWRARRGPDGGATLRLTYPLIAFGLGTVRVPAVDVIVMPIEEGTEGERVAGGSLVGEWVDAPLTARYMRSISGPLVWIAPVYTADEVVAGISPKPPGDVLGFSWSWPSIALVLLFSSVIGGAVVSTTREWLAHRPEAHSQPLSGPSSLDEARLRALTELDRLLGGGPYARDSARELYSHSSRIVREYAEWLGPGLGPDLTSTELMARLDAASRATSELLSEMRTAEAVKFGKLRPEAPAADGHLRVLRGWVADSREEGS